jgi:hypothetical protein
MNIIMSGYSCPGPGMVGRTYVSPGVLGGKSDTGQTRYEIYSYNNKSNLALCVFYFMCVGSIR